MANFSSNKKERYLHFIWNHFDSSAGVCSVFVLFCLFLSFFPGVSFRLFHFICNWVIQFFCWYKSYLFPYLCCHLTFVLTWLKSRLIKVASVQLNVVAHSYQRLNRNIHYTTKKLCNYLVQSVLLWLIKVAL